MTAITRASTIIDTLLDTTATNQLKQDLGTFFVKVYEQELLRNGIDVPNMTNEDKARVFIAKLREYVKHVYSEGKSMEAQTTAATAVTSARTAAMAEIGNEP